MFYNIAFEKDKNEANYKPLLIIIYVDSVHTCRAFLGGRLTYQFALESNHRPFTVSDLAVPYRLYCT